MGKDATPGSATPIPPCPSASVPTQRWEGQHGSGHACLTTADTVQWLSWALAIWHMLMCSLSHPDSVTTSCVLYRPYPCLHLFYSCLLGFCVSLSHQNVSSQKQEACVTVVSYRCQVPGKLSGLSRNLLRDEWMNLSDPSLCTLIKT